MPQCCAYSPSLPPLGTESITLISFLHIVLQLSQYIISMVSFSTFHISMVHLFTSTRRLNNMELVSRILDACILSSAVHKGGCVEVLVVLRDG